MTDEEQSIIRAVVAAMPHTNPLVAEDLIDGHTMHTEAEDLVAIWRAAQRALTLDTPLSCEFLRQHACEQIPELSKVLARALTDGNRLFLWERVQAGQVTLRDVFNALREAVEPPLENFNDHSFREALRACQTPDEYKRLAIVMAAKLRSLTELFAGAVRSNDGALEVVEAFVAMSGSELEPSRTIDGLTVFRVTPREVAR